MSGTEQLEKDVVQYEENDLVDPAALTDSDEDFVIRDEEDLNDGNYEGGCIDPRTFITPKPINPTRQTKRVLAEVHDLLSVVTARIAPNQQINMKEEEVSFVEYQSKRGTKTFDVKKSGNALELWNGTNKVEFKAKFGYDLPQAAELTAETVGFPMYNKLSKIEPHHPNFTGLGSISQKLSCPICYVFDQSKYQADDVKRKTPLKTITLISHLAAHLGLKDYKCSSCGKGFTGSDGRIAHQKKSPICDAPPLQIRARKPKK